MTAEDSVEGLSPVTVITITAPQADPSPPQNNSQGIPLRRAIVSSLSTTMDRISTAMETLWNPPWNTIRDVMMDPRRGSLINRRRPNSTHSSLRSSRNNSRHDGRSTGWRGSFPPSNAFLPPPHCHGIRRSGELPHVVSSTTEDAVSDGTPSRPTTLSSAPLLPPCSGSITTHNNTTSGSHCPSLTSCLFRGTSSLLAQDQQRSLGYSILEAGSQTSLPRDAVNPSSGVENSTSNACQGSREISTLCRESSSRSHDNRSRRNRQQSSYRRSSSRFHSVYQDYFDANDGRDKNFMSALLSILVIASLATALTQPKWFSIRGVCGRKFVGLQLFVELNSYSRTTNSRSNNLFVSSNVNNEVLDDINHSSRNGGSFKLPSREDDSSDEETQSDDTEPLPIPQSSVFSPFDPSSISVFPDSFDHILNKTLIQSGIKLDANQTRHFFATKPKTFHSKKVKKKENESNEPFTSLHDHKPKSCAYPDILPLQRMIILLCLVAIMLNLSQFFLDTLGTSKKLLNLLRLHGVGSIVGVIMTIVIIGFSYMIAAMIELDERTAMTQISQASGSLSGHSVGLLDSTKETPIFPNPQHLEVRFELSYYLVTLSGMIGLMAAACNLLRKPTTPFVFPSHSLLLDPLLFADLEDSRNPIWNGSSSMRLPRFISGLPPPPPPYSP